VEVDGRLGMEVQCSIAADLVIGEAGLGLC